AYSRNKTGEEVVGKPGNAEADEERTRGIEQGDKPGLEIGIAGVEEHLRCSLTHSAILNHGLRAAVSSSFGTIACGKLYETPALSLSAGISKPNFVRET